MIPFLPHDVEKAAILQVFKDGLLLLNTELLSRKLKLFLDKINPRKPAIILHRKPNESAVIHKEAQGLRQNLGKMYG